MKKPSKFKEHIIASKVSGQDNGISFNQAKEVNFDLYKNKVNIDDNGIFSPIADYAFQYYKYKLEGSFYENDKMISKIKIIPRNQNENVFSGYIYVVEEDWQIYGVDMNVSGAQIGNPAIDLLQIKQNYKYDSNAKFWALILQTIDFKVGMLGFNFDGRFSASYQNYNFKPNFTTKTFDKTVLSFDKDATKKDVIYWEKKRVVPLTNEEKKDYVFKDSIKLIRKSKKYLDSVDSKRNRFKLTSPILGYTYANTHQKYWFNYRGLFSKLNYNTVQGLNTTVNFNYFKRNNNYGNTWAVGANLNYGFADHRLRPEVYFTKSWNNFEKPNFTFVIGNKVTQFDARKPIGNLENSIYTLFFRRNYAKFYEKYFANVAFGQDVARGVRFGSSLGLQYRKPLYNHTDYSFFYKDRIFRANNPVQPTNMLASFYEHRLFKASIYATINLGSKYMEYPNSRYTVRNRLYPTLRIGYQKAFAGTNSELNYDFVWLRANQSFSASNLGEFKYNVSAGAFFKKKNIAFMDYYHPLGNETDLLQERFRSFYTLPYYQLSTNDKYAEFHAEHNFKGFVLGKIPLIKKLNFHTILGAKGYFSGGNKPYTEYSVGIGNIGFGKWRFLRVNYVRSNFNGKQQSNFVVGLSF